MGSQTDRLPRNLAVECVYADQRATGPPSRSHCSGPEARPQGLEDRSDALELALGAEELSTGPGRLRRREKKVKKTSTVCR